MIDRSGAMWRGESFEDLHAFLGEYSTAMGQPVTVVRPSACACGGGAFRLVLDDEEGVALRRCEACGAEAFIADSEEHGEDADLGEAQCPCGGEVFELGIGFAIGDDEEVRWVYVAARCVACGGLGTYVDWKIDYLPTAHLLDAT